MSGVYGHQWQAAAVNERRELGQALAYNDQLQRVHQQRRAEVAAQANAALAELTAALLPRLDADSLRVAANITGYSPLVQYDHLREVREQEERTSKTIEQIEADPDFVHGEHRWNTANTEATELTQAKRALAPTLRACEHPRLEHLLEVGYGTDQYAVPFWRLSYYRDWEAADQILERWPGKTFQEVRDQLIEARRASADLGERIDELERKMADLRGLAERHAQEKARLAALPSEYLTRLRSSLGRFIADTGAEALGPRFQKAPVFDLLAKRVFGLAAKLTYMDALATQQLGKQREELTAAMQRSEREIQKFGRPKKAHMLFPAETFQRRFQPRQARYQKQWHRFQDGYDRVYVFNHYERADYLSDFLWWDLMTDGRIDGDFIPEVNDYRSRHPGYEYQRRDWDDDDRADHAAAAALDVPDDPIEPSGAGGLLDPS